MIKIKRLTSSSLFIADEYHFDFPSILIGSRKNCDLYLVGEKNSSEVLLLSEENKALYSHCKDKYKINGKIIIGTHLLKQNDIIDFNGSSIQILDFTPVISNGIALEEKYRELIEQDPEIKSILDLIEKEILIIESRPNDD